MADPATETSQTEAPQPEAMANDLLAAQAERDEYKDKWARARADLENYRKRIQREMEEDRKFAAVPLLQAILPGLDNLHRAIKAASASNSAAELATGVEMVAKQFDVALANVGVKPIASVGQPFDPHLHEAISHRPDAEHPPMTVVEEVERGYTLHERVVRPAKVVVSSPSA